WEATGEEEKDIKCIPSQLQKLFLKLQTSTKRAVETTDLTRSFGWDSSEAWQQHDVQELCRVMFDALEGKFKGTEQEDLINKLYQGKLKDYVKCLEGLKFLTFPYLLTIQLKRFAFDYVTLHRIKLNDRMTFAKFLDLNKFASADREMGPYVYELFSIMIHSGSASGGHYYAYIKSFADNQWYCFNDQNVTQ
ncbi:predicted protein, partial [Nematostella vectensis]